jgi:hypothetical protein
MNWFQLGGSIVAILILAGVARLLRLGESRIASAADARRFAEEALAGFEARHAAMPRWSPATARSPCSNATARRSRCAG